MGTSGAYGGSGGRAWGRVRDQADEFINDSSEQQASDLLRDVLNALDADAVVEAGDQRAGESPSEYGPPLSIFGPRLARLGAGGAYGPGGGSGGGGRLTESSGAGTAGRRGRARLASIGGAVLSAGTALREGDAETLGQLGLDLTALQDLDPFDQVAEILDALVPDTGALEDAELRDASAEALLLLLEGEADDVVGVIQLLVSEYVFAVCITEVGAKLRRGDRTGISSKRDEDTLRQVIRAYADQIEIGAGRLTGANFEAVISQVYGDVQGLL
jgi:hypothetical protein